MTDKVKEVLADLIQGIDDAYTALQDGDHREYQEVKDQAEKEAAHQLNQMLIEARLDELREAAFHLDDWDEYAVKRNQALKAEEEKT